LDLAPGCHSHFDESRWLNPQQAFRCDFICIPPCLSVATDLPNNPRPFLRFGSCFVVEDHAKIDDVERIAGGIESNCNGPLQSAAFDLAGWPIVGAPVN